MPYMADTNILLRFVAPTDPNHALVRDVFVRYSPVVKKFVTLHKIWQNFGMSVRDL